MKRQGLTVTIKELEELVESLIKEGMDQKPVNPNLMKQRWLISIVSKDDSSDNWVIEK